MQPSPLQLIDACKRGDSGAWSDLLRGSRGLVYSICAQYAACPEDVEDLMQEVLLRIWQRLGDYDPARGELKSWIATLTRNLCVDAWRRSGMQRATVSLDAVAHTADEESQSSFAQRIPDPRPTPEQMARRSEMRRVVSRSIRQVAPEMQSVLRMRLIDDLENEEISSQLRIPVGTVKSRMSRGRSQLMPMLPVRAAFGAA